MAARRGRLLALAALLLAACATPPVPPPAEPLPPEEVQAEEAMRSQPLRHLLGRNLKPMPVQALNVRTRCSFRDEIGTRGKLDLHVSDAVVKRFAAEVNMPGKGSCRFDLKSFAQTEKLPTVLLTAAESGCKVRIWQQEKGVTVAFNGCAAQCTGDSFSYLWPILVDARSGRCF
ncbi:hypothetical protein [Rhodocyclus tenuis]|uniref:Uncharacterized protein n=1 Tax=Rhodocyclus tenuis TaxID=1066 RepID=A0A840G0V9_RHOTE|nr:hypothetical protein [Rhodocyclus tenuis]MBB4246103.1 hypothetical protein [Rhodocyclus tenuis]